ncbi:ABC transporter ATP-binding protein [Acuticoccus sp.]|uniref:ABC transporter ATP-binding protein n=1 Tax=Acuticoccus sp. TaxID=1904378 RepID=UPI003B527E13
MTTPLLEVEGLRASYGTSWVLHGIDLAMAQGEFVAVIGANTAGKSTLLRAISGLVPRVEGRIAFEGEDLTRLAPHRIVERGIAHVPEGRHVFREMTVEENLVVGSHVRSSDAVGERVEEIFGLFPRLKERRRQTAGTLSGGEQQMLAVGRGLMLRPRLLVLDEPSLGLAPQIVEEMHGRLREIHASGVSILLVEQNVALALQTASRAYVIQSGEVVLEGPARELADDDRVREAYLGI